jgi:hypothetical protein
MTFSVDQIQKLLNIIRYNHTFLIATNLGTDVLSKEDENLLQIYGVDMKIFDKNVPEYEKMFLLGRLTSTLNEAQIRQLEFNDVEKYVKRGQYIDLSQRERNELKMAKMKTYSHIKGLGSRVENKVTNIITEEEQKRKSDYEKVIKKEIERGVVERKSVTNIVSEIGNSLNDWQRDWGRIVETEMNDIFQQGRAATMTENFGEDTNVYKEVYEKACRYCISAYLTSGIGSKPKIFKLSELEANGSNVGKKVTDWEPVLYSMHPHCRCLLKRVPEGYEWDEEKGQFVLPEKWERKVKRKSKIKIQVGDKNFEV